MPFRKMSDEIVINGRSLDASDQLSDASSSNYILIRTKGEPLRKKQKDELRRLKVKIQEFTGNEHEQIYLCKYEPKSLDAIRSLDYIEYANVYDRIFAIPEVLNAATHHAAESEESGPFEVDILLHKDITEVTPAILTKIAKAANIAESEITSDAEVLRLKVVSSRLDELADLDEVRVIHPTNEPGLFTNTASQILQIERTGLDGATLRGKGQLICIADTGFDMGSLDDVHNMFIGRVKQLYSWGRTNPQQSDDPDGHGTHVCGSALGSGQHVSQGLIEGTAPDADLIVQSLFSGFDDWGSTKLGGIPVDLGPLFGQAYQHGARIHSNSWGTPLPRNLVQRPYDGKTESIDRFVWEHQDFTILFAAGNDGQDQDFDGTVNERSLGAEASAKNCITVGASENYRPNLTSGPKNLPYTYGTFFPKKFTKNPLKDDHQANNPEGLAAFASRGPTAEGRLKPDIVAPGTAILSARSRKKKLTGGINKAGESGDDKYMYLSGTSMATPLVAGCCALIRESLLHSGYRDEDVAGKKSPTGSLIKALLINGAVPVKGQYMPDNIGTEPNPHSGFGRVNVSNSLVKTNDKFLGYCIGVVDEAEEESVKFDIPIPSTTEGVNGNTTIPSGNLTLKVTMVYADQPGGALINDLNLVVMVGDKERHGNQVASVFEPESVDGYDRRNNVEQVVWPNVSGDSAQIVVRPYRMLDDVPFACAWRFSTT